MAPERFVPPIFRTTGAEGCLGLIARAPDLSLLAFKELDSLFNVGERV